MLFLNLFSFLNTSLDFIKNVSVLTKMSSIPFRYSSKLSWTVFVYFYIYFDIKKTPNGRRCKKISYLKMVTFCCTRKNPLVHNKWFRKVKNKGYMCITKKNIHSNNKFLRSKMKAILCWMVTTLRIEI